MATTVSEVVIAASLDEVWSWLVEPDRVKQWQYGAQLITDWTVGSSIRFRNEWDGQVFEQWGTVLEVDRPRTIRYTLFFPRPGLEDVPENAFVMTYVLEDRDGATLLQIVQEDNRPDAPAATTEDDDDGPDILGTLKALIEGHEKRQ